jgi:hypothetical protein
VTFCDNDQNIKEAMFLCSSETEKLHPKKIISNLLNTEDDLTHFCKNYHLESGNFPSMVIEAYQYLLDMTTRPNNTEISPNTIRKRKSETIPIENGVSENRKLPKMMKPFPENDKPSSSINNMLTSNVEVNISETNIPKASLNLATNVIPAIGAPAKPQIQSSTDGNIRQSHITEMDSSDEMIVFNTAEEPSRLV